MQWTVTQLPHTSIAVGPCAWHVSALLAHPQYIREHPSLIVIYPEDDPDDLKAAAAHLGNLPVLLILREPTFTRHFEATICTCMKSLDVDRIEAAGYIVEDWIDLKGGAAVQVLTQLRQAGTIAHIALGHEDAQGVEWLAQNTTARLLIANHSLTEQQAAYRAIPAAHDHGMACIARYPTPHTPDELAFALADRARVLPVFTQPIPQTLQPLSDNQLQDIRDQYQQSHPAPAPLPRSVPPE